MDHPDENKSSIRAGDFNESNEQADEPDEEDDLISDCDELHDVFYIVIAELTRNNDLRLFKNAIVFRSDDASKIPPKNEDAIEVQISRYKLSVLVPKYMKALLKIGECTWCMRPRARVSTSHGLESWENAR